MNKKNEKVRVRFAPSPTGYLHIGSARTAFFNWLYAARNRGSFILRIEDTNIERHREETIDLMIKSLKWLGMDWDEGPDIGGSCGPYRQSQRTDIYNAYANKLVSEKKAYYCFCSPEELKKRRSKDKGAEEAYEYDGKCRRLPPDTVKANIESGKPYAIRFLVPQNKTVSFKDTVYGSIKVDTSTIGDFIIIRSNSLPTYNYSVVIDDALMKITHVIRGEDHLTNTPRQILIYNAFGFSIPSFTHLPMILGEDGQKLSKRHGSISIEKYIEEGFIREAILNYLALLGWAYGEKTTIFSIEDLIKKFSLESINKKPAKFDYNKLLWMNGHYIRNMDDSRLKELLEKPVKDFLATKDASELEIKGVGPEDKLVRIVPLIKERIKTINGSTDLIKPFFIKIRYTKELAGYFKNKKIDASGVLEKTYDALSRIDNRFPAETIEKELRLVSEKLGLNLRKTAEVIRIALWGSNISPPLFKVMEILGKELTLSRISEYMKVIS
jgi:glutamyl-tRNA synthetase